jgi:uncharacterized membrane protein YphA (DoxX/SURF4 family)
VLSGWPPAARVLYRFLFLYLTLYSLPAGGRLTVLTIVPGVWRFSRVWQWLDTWVAIHVFHLSGAVTIYRLTGSGDRTLDYIQLLCMITLALAGTLVWCMLDRRRNDSALDGWLRLLIRYTLAATLLSYGFEKVFPLQFPYPNLLRLNETFGEFSPMGVLWSFMGSSPAYTIFAGSAEVLGGILLLFRRTTTVGALVSAAVLANIVALNFCYDVPVKLYSLNLLLMSVYLAAPDLRGLAAFLLFKRSAAPAPDPGPVWDARWMRFGAVGLKILVGGFLLVQNFLAGYATYKRVVWNAARPPLYGAYEVEAFTRDGKDVPPLMTDRSRWKRVIVTFPMFLQVRSMDDTIDLLPTEYGPSGAVTISKQPFTYSRPDSDRLVLKGNFRGDALSIGLRKADTTRLLLASRGFHWINEVPLNR